MDAFPANERMRVAIAETATLSGKLDQPGSQLLVLRLCCRLVVQHRA